MTKQQDELYFEVGRGISEVVEEDDRYDEVFGKLNVEAQNIYKELEEVTEPEDVDDIEIESTAYDAVEVRIEGENTVGNLESFFYNPEDAEDTVCKTHGKPTNGSESQPSRLPEGTVGEYF